MSALSSVLRARPDASGLDERIAGFGAWRDALSAALVRYIGVLETVGPADDDARERFAGLCERLAGDRVSVALLAEFSRGKSELVNALFFSDTGRRIVPSSAGRTTMCPTELRWDPGLPPSVRLLPIETRTSPMSLGAWRNDRAAWQERAIDLDDGASLERALASVSETLAVDAGQAQTLGFAADPLAGTAAGEPVRIPRWRHAIVNYPHPLLARGLVIIDTPGLNALGAEPELTLGTLSDADAVLFVLAADTGVTRSEAEVWREHVEVSRRGRHGRYAVLNKIDGLWDGLRDEAEIELEIARQASAVASTLDLPAGQVFPVSAQKALVARLKDDAGLLRRSRILTLEQALGDALVAGRQGLLRDRLQGEFEGLHRDAELALEAERRAQVTLQMELNGLHGRNRDAITALAAQIAREREVCDRGRRQLLALRSVLGRHGRALAEVVSAPVARRHLADARELMRASHFSTGLRQAMKALMDAAHADFTDAEQRIAEIATLMNAMYRSFSSEHGLTLGSPVRFSLRRHYEALERIERLQQSRFGALALVTNEKRILMRRFFESLAMRLCELYERLASDCAAWQRAMLAPVEARLREREAQLGRRAESVRRVLEAGESLEQRMAEVAAERAAIEARIVQLEMAAQEVGALFDVPGKRDMPGKRDVPDA